MSERGFAEIRSLVVRFSRSGSPDSSITSVRDFLESQGVRVPGDVQIIGYDGIVDYATGRYICSTIVQPVPQMAETAVRFLLHPEAVSSGVSACLPVVYAPGGTTRDG